MLWHVLSIKNKSKADTVQIQRITSQSDVSRFLNNENKWLHCGNSQQPFGQRQMNTGTWRHQQPTDKSSFIPHRAGSNTLSVAPWDFPAASLASSRVLATLTTIPIGMVIYLTDNYWMTFDDEVNVCTMHTLLLNYSLSFAVNQDFLKTKESHSPNGISIVLQITWKKQTPKNFL